MASRASEPVNVIVGLGGTGLSCAKYFASVGESFKLVDSRTSPPGLAELKSLFPQVEVELGDFQESTFLTAKQLVVSPGVSLKTEVIAAAKYAGVPVTGDIDIFAKRIDAPIIAVTGSNGKSTVVAIVVAILQQAGVKFGLGGNLDGANFKPALDLLQEPPKDFYVLELSSFQLETTSQLAAEVAVVLNISPDHMDRYDDLKAYAQAKQSIFNGCKQVAINLDESSSQPLAELQVPVWGFGINTVNADSLQLVNKDGVQYIALGSEAIVAVHELKIVGQHNLSNAMAAIALTLAVGVDKQSIRQALCEFAGLPHRCQWVENINGIDFYNDSKGTNVGATTAAIEGLGQRITGRIILIAGGVGKGADFSPLASVVKQWAKAVVLIGEDAAKIASFLESDAHISFAKDMREAVTTALNSAEAGDVVLLSPACASFDMFENFQHRGQMFVQAVQSLK